ncbi:hypothetical protein [Spiroplasma endosymbiont of Stenodema calcarata]|uniref:hypothetical protein n=1 Tax=Spiroplasma endosymbiont of Stenodema calcarata TaxID=3139328 RepID=UPI003CCB644E
MNITESIKFDKLKEENEELKNKISEKDKEIEFLKNNWIIKRDNFIELEDEIVKLKQQQLYKEDFDLTCYAECNCDGEGCGLIDNSKYELLPSKEELK